MKTTILLILILKAIAADSQPIIGIGAGKSASGYFGALQLGYVDDLGWQGAAQRRLEGSIAGLGRDLFRRR